MPYPELIAELRSLEATAQDGGDRTHIPKAVHRLLSETLIKVTNKDGVVYFLRFAELELYHPRDPYTHGGPDQSGPPGTWYFHRAGKDHKGKFKGGTFKGLDVVCGREGEAGGILIRSVYGVTSPDSHGQVVPDFVSTGPSKTVDLLMDLSGADQSELSANAGHLELIPAPYPSGWKGIRVGPRIGLSQAPKPRSGFYRGQPFRYIPEHMMGFVKKEKTRMKPA